MMQQQHMGMGMDTSMGPPMGAASMPYTSVPHSVSASTSSAYSTTDLGDGTAAYATDGRVAQVGYATLMQLPDAARNELSSFEDRFGLDPNVEVSQDNQSYIVRCSLKREHVPQLRLVIPRTYPAAPPSVERGVLDLDSFYYDDLQNAIHDQLGKMAPRSIMEILNSWDNTVQQFYSSQQGQQMPANTFEELLSSPNFSDLLS
jgi:hypothetical protein